MGTDELMRSRTVNPEDEILWREIANAVHQVEINGERQISIEKAGYKVDIVKMTDAILISLEPQDPDPPTLILPH
jgi:hypothetical protein